MQDLGLVKPWEMVYNNPKHRGRRGLLWAMNLMKFDSGSGSTDDDADDHEDLAGILLFLVEAEHEQNLL